MKKDKTPSLFRQLVAIYYEQAQKRKAIRTLEKQTWSYEFLSALLINAGKTLGDNIQLVIKNKDGQSMTLTYQKAEKIAASETYDSIFNHLDDEVAIQKFVREHSTR